MSLLNLTQRLKNMEGHKEEAKDTDEEISGVKNAIRGFVEAKKGEANSTDKGKKGVLKNILKKIKGRRGKLFASKK